MESKSSRKSEDIEKIQKMFELMRTSKLRDKNSIGKAMEKQDNIRKKAGKGKSLSAEIRKWRDAEHAPGA